MSDDLEQPVGAGEGRLDGGETPPIEQLSPPDQNASEGTPSDYRSSPEYQAELDRIRQEAVEEGRRKGQSERDRLIARERQRWEQELKSKGLVDQLARLHEEDPDEFARLVSRPEVAKEWARHLEQPQHQVVQQATMQALDQFNAYWLGAFKDVPGLKDLPEKDKQRLAKALDDGPEAFFPLAIEALADAKAEKKASEKAKTLAVAMTEDALAKRRAAEPVPDATPTVGGAPGGAAAERHALIEAHQRGQIPRAEFLRKLKAYGG